VDWAAHNAAGPRLAGAGGAIGPCETGDAKPTPAFGLDPPRSLHHPPGRTDLGGGAYGDVDLLASCYRRSLQVVGRTRRPSIAFPTNSTGLYGFPPEQPARIAVATISIDKDRRRARPGSWYSANRPTNCFEPP
jgi:O-acetyl-ADP-ribose deacetylase